MSENTNKNLVGQPIFSIG